jgi:hypothetical protein
VASERTIHEVISMRSLLFALSMLIFSSGAIAQHHQHDRPSTHGMLAFGSSKIYLSHLPMFHSPHDYQLIVEAEVSNPKLYQQTLNKLAADEYMTILPERFSLTEMMESPHPFKANLYHGHFERGGTDVGSMTFTIKKILYAKKFDGRKAQANEYFYFGEGSEIFGAHIISAAPDFDHVVRVKKENDGSVTVVDEIYHETGDLAE